MKRKQITVLLVEQDAADAQLALGVLACARAPAFAVVHVARPATAVAMLATDRVDVVLLGVRSVDVSALQGVAMIRRAAHDTAIVVCGAPRDTDVALEVLTAGADDYVVKDTPEALTRVIRCAMMRRHSEHTARRLAAIVDCSDDAIIGKALDGTISSWNAAAERMYGYCAADAIGEPITILSCSQDQDGEFREILARVARGERVDHFETTRARRDREVIDVSVTVSPIRNADGCVTGASTVARDITDRRRSEARLREAEDRFRRAFDDAPIGMALLSLDGRVEQANTALCVICAATQADLMGADLFELVHPADRAQQRRELRELLAGKTAEIRNELRFMPATGSLVQASIHGILLVAAAGRASNVLCQFQDITDRKSFESQLQFMADHDPLTGLLNRRKFEADLAGHVAHVKRYGTEGALLVLDIDHFKDVNDTLGHNAGDELIVSIATLLRARLRASDTVARLGGDEFAVLLPKVDQAGAAKAAQGILDTIRTRTTLLSGESQRITASVGVAMFDADTEPSGEAIIIDADLAMYDAKEAGRDGYAFYSTSERRVSRTKARTTWAGRIEDALENGGFVLLAQPILDLRTREIRRHELLVRMLDDHGDLIPPASFLYIAERFGLIGRLDEWVATQAIGLIERHPDLRFCVNISGKSLGDQRLLEAIEERLRITGIDPAQLVFEVTETAAVANIAQAQAFAQRLRDLGCRFALDDFGAGFGSFYYLKHLPFDFVKIDGEFIRHLASGHIDQLIVEAVVGIARGLGKETIAEFVTDADTERIVQRLGVDHAQGYHISKPVPLTELLATTAA